MKIKHRIIVIQAAAPDYRIPFFKELSEKISFKLVTGKSYYRNSVKTAKEVETFNNTVLANNFYFFGRRFLFQKWEGLFKDLLCKESITITELNPRSITSWLFLIKSYIFSRGKTVLWGHLLNSKGKTPIIRKLMVKMASGVIFYTHTQLDLYHKLFNKSLITSGVAPNSVVKSDQVRDLKQPGHDFIYVGRLVKEKKVKLMLEAFKEAREDGKRHFRLHVVGNGPELQELISWTKNENLEEAIIFHGHISDREKLAELYSKSIASVSPGPVGLALTQSLSFGKPMIISDEKHHGPEFEGLLIGETGSLFETNNKSALSRELITFDNEREIWAARSKKISEFCKMHYTVESMSNGFIETINKLNKY